jgi:hypothetical protein
MEQKTKKRLLEGEIFMSLLLTFLLLTGVAGSLAYAAEYQEEQDKKETKTLEVTTEDEVDYIEGLLIQSREDNAIVWEKAAEYNADQYIAQGIDTYAELESLKSSGKIDNNTLMFTKLAEKVNQIEIKREEERKAAEEAARKAAAAEAARKAAAAKKAATSSSSTSVKNPTPALTEKPSALIWSKGQVSGTLAAAADYYGLTGAKREWIISKGTSIAYKESRYNTHAWNSSNHIGLFQFSDAWASAENRLDGTWSCYRFVKVYVDGGEAKIRQHWRATY